MLNFLPLCLAILSIAALAQPKQADPRLQRIDRFLERSYRLRLLRNLELAAQESAKRLMRSDEETTTAESSTPKEKEDETEAVPADAVEMRSAKVLPRTRSRDDAESPAEVVQPRGGNDKNYVAVPHPVPIVVHKLIPVPLILPQPFMVPESMQASFQQQAQSWLVQRPSPVLAAAGGGR